MPPAAGRFPFLFEDFLGHLIAIDHPRLAGGDVHRQVLDQPLEIRGAGHEVGLAVHLDQNADPSAGVNIGTDGAFARRLRRTFHRRRVAFLAQDLVARSRSPAASTRADLQSIMGARSCRGVPSPSTR